LEFSHHPSVRHSSHRALVFSGMKWGYDYFLSPSKYSRSLLAGRSYKFFRTSHQLPESNLFSVPAFPTCRPRFGTDFAPFFSFAAPTPGGGLGLDSKEVPPNFLFPHSAPLYIFASYPRSPNFASSSTVSRLPFPFLFLKRTLRSSCPRTALVFCFCFLFFVFFFYGFLFLSFFSFFVIKFLSHLFRLMAHSRVFVSAVPPLKRVLLSLPHSK